MEIVIPLRYDPLLNQVTLTFIEGTRKTDRTYSLEKIENGKTVIYIISDDFPECMIKVIFGPEARKNVYNRKRSKKVVLAF